MTDKPIIFNAPMIRALLDGRKTQTRLVLKPQPPDGGACYWAHLPGYECWMWQGDPEPMPGNSVYIGPERIRVPYAPGDCLYVREAWRTHLYYDDLSPSQMSGEETIVFESDHPPIDRRPNRLADGRYRHARFMPRWASRLTLTVTDMRVQRLQDISEADAVAEGCLMDPEPNDDGSHFPAEIAHERGGDVGWDSARDWFADLWDSIYSPNPWDANPWVVAVTFTVQRGNIDQ